MSSKTDGILLIPGPGGWEIWQGNRERGFRRSLENGAMQASGIGKIPPGRLLMGFPVREALAVPFKVQTDDEAMFDDLVSMHLEKSGIRPEEDAGRLTDVFPAGREDGQTTLLSVVLSAPAEGTMPQRAPVGFDISARLFPMAGNAVTLWQELGRWVFAVTSGGHLAYFQSLSGSGLGADAVRDIRLALTQLSLQGVSLDVDKAVIWTTGHHSDPTDDAIHEFGRELGSEVSAEPKPRPVLPAPMSRLVPADVRAQHRARAERRKRVLLAYLGLAGFLAYDYFRLDGDLKKQQAELEQTRLRHSGIGLFKDDWKQLAAASVCLRTTGNSSRPSSIASTGRCTCWSAPSVPSRQDRGRTCVLPSSRPLGLASPSRARPRTRNLPVPLAASSSVPSGTTGGSCLKPARTKRNAGSLPTQRT